MKKLGNIMAVVGDDNCQEDDKPETEEQCEREPCEPQWYMTDWSEVIKSQSGYANSIIISFCRQIISV